MRTVRIILGLLIWLAAVGGLWHYAHGLDAEADVARAGRLLSQYAFEHHPRIKLKMDRAVWTAPGNPIFMKNDDGTLRQIGQIETLDRTLGQRGRRYAWAVEATAMLYPGTPAIPHSAEVTYYSSDCSLEWIAQTMLPPHKRRQLAEMISEAIAEHRDEIIAALEPIIWRSVADAFTLFQQQIGPFLAEQTEQLDALAAELRADILDQRLAPVARDRVWPILMREAEPLLEKMVRETADRIPWWRLGRMTVQDVFGGRRVEREVRRFIAEEVTDVIESHSDEIEAAIQKVINEVAEDADVRQALHDSMQRLIEDHRLNALLSRMVRELVIDNPDLHAILERHWTSDEAYEAFRLAGERFEPVLADMGRLLVADNDQIAPEFSHVIRAGLLGMDQRWYLIELPETVADQPDTDPSPPLPVRRGQFPPAVPFTTHPGLTP